MTEILLKVALSTITITPCDKVDVDKTENKTYHTVGTVPKSNRNIVDRRNIDNAYHTST
jgi:hypothetical protein